MADLSQSILESDWNEAYFLQQSTVALRDAQTTGKPIIIYGAGQLGTLLAELLGSLAVGFIDDTTTKHNTIHYGLPILKPEDARKKYDDNVLVVVGMYTAHHRYVDTRAKLTALGFANVAPPLCVLHQYGRLPYMFIEPLTCFIARKQDYITFSARLDDDVSRKVLDGHLRLRGLSDYDHLIEHPRYPLDVLQDKLSDETVYVDGGAFDGDTVENFLLYCGEHFSKCIAYEPDCANSVLMQKRMSKFSSAIQAKIEMREAALWCEKGTVSFSAAGDVSSHIAKQGGGSTISTEMLDSLIDEKGKLYIKLDLEGAEEMALQGGRKLLLERRPLLGISVYHKPDDILRFSELLDEWGCKYRYALRCHGGDGTDLMLYCF